MVAAGALDGLDELAAADLGLVQQWAAQLDELGELIGSRFFRPEPRERALAYVKGLCRRWPESPAMGGRWRRPRVSARRTGGSGC